MKETTKPSPSRKRALLIRSIIVTVLVAPLLVTAAFMWSLWDPSHYLQNVRMAVVNEDAGTQKDGQKVNFGDDVLEGLLNTSYMNFTELPATEANDGLRDGDFMVVLSIPKDFSQEVASVIDEHPKQPEVVISFNDQYGTNTPLLTSGLVPGIQKGIAKGIAEGYSSEILGGMNRLGEGLKKAADGAQQLDDGAAQLKAGTEKGVDGATQLKDGSAQLSDGASRLDQGMGQLLDGTSQLGDGAAQIDAGVGQLTDKVIPLLKQAGTTVEMLKPLADQLETLGLQAQAQEIRDRIAVLDTSNPDALANQLAKLKDGTAQMSYNLNDPSAPYLQGALQLKDGSSQLAAGAARLDNGMGQLLDGTHQLDAGVAKLKDGTSQLDAGLSEGAQQAPEIKDIEASSHQIAVPVAYEEDYRHAVQELIDEHDPTSKVLSGGVTMILILVFGYLLMALVSMLAPHILGTRKHASTLVAVLAGFAVVGAGNTALLWLLTGAGMAAGFHIAHLGAYFLAMVLIAAHGTSIFQFLRLAFGRLAGGALALGFFAYGVFAFGGVWPIQLTPAPMRAMHSLHPMTYAKDVFVRTVDGNFDGTYYTGVVVLVVSTIVFIGLSVFARNYKLNKAEEHTHTPELQHT